MIYENLIVREPVLSSLGFLFHSKNHALTFKGLYRFSFQSLYHQNNKLMKQCIFETSTWNDSDRANEARCNDYHWLQWWRLQEDSDNQNESDVLLLGKNV